jgi:hypothetical protein
MESGVILYDGIIPKNNSLIVLKHLPMTTSRAILGIKTEKVILGVNNK